MLGRVAAFISLSGVAGCTVPWVAQIYRPDAPNAKLLESSCAWQSGPGLWDIIEIAEQGLTVRVHAQDRDDRIAFEVRFLIPADITAKLVSPNFTVVPRNKSAPVKAAPREIKYSPPAYYYAWRELSIDAVMRGETLIGPVATSRAIYSLSFSIPAWRERSPFSLELPPIQINGEARAFSKIDFTPATEAYLAGCWSGAGTVLQNSFPLDISDSGYSTTRNAEKNRFTVTLTQNRVNELGGPKSPKLTAVLQEIASRESFCGVRAHRFVESRNFGRLRIFDGRCE
jgi:hypothetical protein